MDLMNWLAGESTSLSPGDLFLRLTIAAIFGGLIGFEREMKNKPAGLRTHMLVAIAAAMFTLITFELYQELGGPGTSSNADPMRIIEAVTSGVAFLAAGAIIRSRGDVQGLTTGANMWLAGAIGVACGAGYYTLATMGVVFAMLVLTVLRKLEPKHKDEPKH